MNERKNEKKEERKAKLALEKKKLSEMKSFKDKKDYILDYYKFHIISIVLILITVIYIINTTWINPPDKTGVGLLVTNGNLEKSAVLKANAEAAIGIQPGYEVTITSLALDAAQEVTYAQAMQQKLVVMLVSGEADLVIGTEDFFVGNSSASFFADLSQVLKDAKYKNLQDRFVMGLVPVDLADPSTVTENEKVSYKTQTEDIVCVKRPIGIRLDGCKVLDNLGFRSQGSVIGFSSTGKRPEMSLKLLDYILGL